MNLNVNLKMPSPTQDEQITASLRDLAAAIRRHIKMATLVPDATTQHSKTLCEIQNILTQTNHEIPTSTNTHDCNLPITQPTVLQHQQTSAPKRSTSQKHPMVTPLSHKPVPAFIHTPKTIPTTIKVTGTNIPTITLPLSTPTRRSKIPPSLTKNIISLI